MPNNLTKVEKKWNGNYDLMYRRNSHEKYWIVNNVSWYVLQGHIEKIMERTTEKEIFIIIKAVFK